jgi:hypothetical protein
VSKIAKHGVYTILSTPVHQPDTNTWTLEIHISWEHDGGLPSRPFSSADPSYQTEEEADLYGIAFGQLICDKKIPGLPVS